MIDYQPGDILLVPDEGSFSVVSVLQGMTRLNPVILHSTWQGSIYSNHAAIAIGTGKKYNSTELNVNQVAHATGKGGLCRGSVASYGGAMLVFRLTGSSWAGKAAHDVALAWTDGPSTGTYNTAKAANPAFHSSSYGSGARERARHYHLHRKTRGGPPGIKHEKKSMFCSMFAIAAYQAALGEGLSETYMALDAKNTSPMKLQDYLKTNGFWSQITA
ncbi:MAG: hypothetical protein IV100_15210 [Myxococcales bacterium]|nr:hypothetical protein [Myxococcales bacterium]